MQSYQWSRLNHLQVGRFGETFVKLELTRLGCDIYTTDVDDRGIDFVIRLDSSNYLDIQVKTVRDYNYTYVRKYKFPMADNSYLALVLLLESQPPSVYLIPRSRWKSPDSVFADRDFEGRKSAPEFGINLSPKRVGTLQEFSIDRVAGSWSRPTI